MRRPRALVPFLLAVLLVQSNVFQNLIANSLWEEFKNHPFFKKWGLSIELAFVSLLALLYVLWDNSRQKAAAADEPTEPSPVMRQRLVDRVLEFAQARFDGGLYALARREFQLAERPLRVSTADRAMDVNIEQHYRALTGPLVILGEPGTGKTTLLHELATLLSPRNDQDPIPVPFDLADWAVNEERLADWMAGELNRNYGVASAQGRSWIRKELILPFLDGLDEVPDAKRAICVKRINEYRAAHPGVRFVLTCREIEYSELRAAIDVTAAVVVRTLSRENVSEFLASNAARFSGLRQALDADPALWEVMDTPLMLWVAAFAFLDGPGPAPQPGTSIRARLFDRYVDKMLQRERGPGDAFSPDEAKRWLRRTAQCLIRADAFSFHLEDLSPAWLPQAMRSAVGLRVRIVAALLGGLLFGIAATLLIGLSFGLTMGLAFFVLELIAGQVHTYRTPVDALSWSWRDLRADLVDRSGWLVAYVVVILVAGLASWLRSGQLDSGVYVLLVQLPAVWLIPGLAHGLVRSSVARRAHVNHGLKKSATYAAFIAVVVAALAYCAVLVELARPLSWVLTGITVPLFQRNGGSFCCYHLTLRFHLAQRQYIPWRYVRFLRFATERVLMIRQGGSFRFIHRMLQEHLAATSAKEDQL